MNKLEHQILCALQTYDQKLFPKVYGGGSFTLENGTAFSFIILEKLGQTLASYLDARNKPFSLKTVCQIGINLIEALEYLHSFGQLHNDLKLDNILIGDQYSSIESLKEIKLIDFGLSTSFLGPNGAHIKQEQIHTKGNYAFVSKNTIIGLSPSRRDDLISVVYLLFYLY